MTDDAEIAQQFASAQKDLWNYVVDGAAAQEAVAQMREALAPFNGSTILVYDPKADRVCISRDAFNRICEAVKHLPALETLVDGVSDA